MKLIGLLGGMGPLATVTLFERIVRMTDATSDQEHVPLLIYNLPQIPDRTAHILGRGPSPLEAMRHGVQTLACGGVDAIGIACNTAHHYLPNLRQTTDVPIYDMIELTAACIAERHQSKILLLATDGTIDTGLYHRKLGEKGIAVETPAEDMQRQLMGLIYSVKAGKPFREQADQIMDELSQAGLPMVIGCTELSTAYAGTKAIDPMTCLARALIEHAGAAIIQGGNT
jgi:aspartate racemase